jgi:hypothetical protein
MLLTSDSTLPALQRLIGTWQTEATHPALPGVVVHGTVTMEWLEGERFLILRARNEHPDFPDSISLLGFAEQDRVDPVKKPKADTRAQLSLHYYDSRGVFRAFDASVDDQSVRFWRDAPGFSQRFTGIFAEAGKTIRGLWQLNEDDVQWNDDLAITYRRQ